MDCKKYTSSIKDMGYVLEKVQISSTFTYACICHSVQVRHMQWIINY